MPSSERTFGPFGWRGRSDDDSATESEETVDDDGTASDQRRTRERTLGPMNWTVPFGGDVNPDPERSPGVEQSTGFVYPRAYERPPSYERPRRDATDEAVATRNERLVDRLRRAFSTTAVLVGVGLILLIDTMSLMVPLLAAIGGGLIGGFVAGYVAGGVLRGTVHALLAGVFGGVAVGFLTAAIGATLGLFMEPATLLGTQTGLVVPTLSGWGLPEPLLVTAVFAAMITIDATIGGVVGGTLRSLIDRVR